MYTCTCMYTFRYEKSVIDGDTHYMIVGYCTIYYYYAYPDKTKPRIRSVIIVINPRLRRWSRGLLLLTLLCVFLWFLS